MAEVRHGYLKTTEGIHIPYQWIFDSASARENASGLTADDEGKLARQTDDDSLWLLIDASAASWVQIGAGASSIQGYAVSGSAPSDWDRLVWSESASEWSPTASPTIAFTELSDTPSAYTGYSGCFLAVNAGETGIEFVSAPTGGAAASNHWVADHVVAPSGGTASSLTDALNAASAGEMIYIAPGLYQESVIISSPLTVMGAGDSTEIQGASDAGVAITITGASVVLAGLKITHEAGSTLIDVQGTDVQLLDITASGGHDGIYLNGATKTLIQGCRIWGQLFSGISADNGTASAIIRWNRIYGQGSHGIAGDATELDDSLFADNEIKGTAGYGINLWAADRAQIVRNVVADAENDGIRNYQCASPLIASNYVIGCTRGMEIYDTDDAAIVNNWCHQNSAEGIWSYGNRMRISNNDCRGNGDTGIELYGTVAQTGYMITNNICTDNAGYGIDLGNTSTSNVFVHGNYLARNTSGSIGHDTGTNNVVISDNFVV